MIEMVIVVGLATFYVVWAWEQSALPPIVRELRAMAEAARDNGRTFGMLVTCPICLAIWIAVMWSLVWFFVAPVLVAIGAAAGLAIVIVSSIPGYRN